MSDKDKGKQQDQDAEDTPVLPSGASDGAIDGTTDLDATRTAVVILAALATILMLQFAGAVLIPVVVAVLISYVLAPGVTSMEKRGVPRVAGSFVAIALLCGGLGVGVYTLTDQALAIVEAVPTAARRLAERFESKSGEPEGALEKVQEAAKEVEKAAEKASDPSPVARGATRVQIVEPAFAARDYLWAGGRGLIGFLGQFAIVLFLVFFLLVTGDLYKRKLVKIAGPTLAKRRITVQILDEINEQIESYIKVQLLTNTVVAIATGATLWWFGVENYAMWGLLAGLFNSIPYAGPVVVKLGLGVVTFMQFDDLLKSAYVCGVAFAITSLEGFLLTPALVGRAAQMNPVAIFVGLLFWTWIWGVWGTVLAVPMLMIAKAICDHVEDLQSVGELLGE